MKKTKYDATFLRPPRKSYKDYEEYAQPSGESVAGGVNEHFDDNGTARLRSR